jgi:aryl-alcohol dehydrogenase-like predicted oxidoreductase
VRYVEAGGAKVSAVGVGTWQFGSPEWGYGKEYARREAGQIVRRALDLGVNLIDTAEYYGFGRSERIVGNAVVGRHRDVFLATKVFPVLPLAPVVVQRGRASARRLGVDVIDLYQVHWPNPLARSPTAMKGMRRLLDAGTVRHVGVSNFTLAQWLAAEGALGSPVLSNQVSFSLMAGRPATDLVPYAVAHDRLVIAYSPLAQGFLSGRYGPGNRPQKGVRSVNPLFARASLERAGPLLEALREVGTAHDATPAQVALAWVLRHPNTVAIPGARTVEQLEANVEAAEIDLADDEHARLTAEAGAFRATA